MKRYEGKKAMIIGGTSGMGLAPWRYPSKFSCIGDSDLAMWAVVWRRSYSCSCSANSAPTRRRPLAVFAGLYGVLWLIATINVLIRWWRGTRGSIRFTTDVRTYVGCCPVGRKSTSSTWNRCW